MTFLELLDEMELQPHGTDILDVDKLLCAAGFRRHGETVIRAYTKPEWQLTYTFRNDIRVVPVDYLLRVVREVRANLQGEGRLHEHI